MFKPQLFGGEKVPAEEVCKVASQKGRVAPLKNPWHTKKCWALEHGPYRLQDMAIYGPWLSFWSYPFVKFLKEVRSWPMEVCFRLQDRSQRWRGRIQVQNISIIWNYRNVLQPLASWLVIWNMFHSNKVFHAQVDISFHIFHFSTTPSSMTRKPHSLYCKRLIIDFHRIGYLILLILDSRVPASLRHRPAVDVSNPWFFVACCCGGLLQDKHIWWLYQFIYVHNHIFRYYFPSQVL